LTEADRLGIPHVQDAGAQRISSVKRPPNAGAIIPASNGAVQRRRAAANKKADVEKTKLGPQQQKKKGGRSNAIVEVKPCLPNAFAGVLKALNISRECKA
jgi:hypothetical protein